MSIQISEYDPQSAPPDEVLDIVERGLVEIVRRVELYESDGSTRWNPDLPDDEVSRLIDATVTVDYGSDERRKIDLLLDNIDQKLRANPNGGMWYDKIIKPYYGIVYNAMDAYSPIAIIESQAGSAEAIKVSHDLAAMGFDRTDILLGETEISALKKYTHIFSLMTNSATAISPLLRSLYDQGKTIVTVGTGNGVAHLPHYSTEFVYGVPVSWGIAPVSTDTPTTGAFTAEATSPSTMTGIGPTGLAMGATALAVWPAVGPVETTAAIIRNGAGGFWLDIHLPNLIGTQARKLLAAALRYMKNITPIKTWETQMGEFYIDRIDTENFPDTAKITARDGTKKLMNDKLARTSTFEVGTSLKDFVVANLALAGIPVAKMRLNIGAEALESEMSFEKGTSRWEMIKSALESFGYEKFFDAFGNFVARKYLDPSTAPVSQTFKTGPDGNLVDFQKSVNDSRIYNHIIVTADPSDGDTNPVGYFGEAEVTDESSPVHWTKIGRRVLPVDAPWIGSDEEADALAAERLKVTALESYELSFSSIYYPWLEAGTIVRILDPDATDIEPDRFLLDSISYPLSLGPMSATGKRVTFVGSSGGNGEEEVVEG